MGNVGASGSVDAFQLAIGHGFYVVAGELSSQQRGDRVAQLLAGDRGRGVVLTGDVDAARLAEIVACVMVVVDRWCAAARTGVRAVA